MQLYLSLSLCSLGQYISGCAVDTASLQLKIYPQDLVHKSQFIYSTIPVDTMQDILSTTLSTTRSVQAAMTDRRTQNRAEDRERTWMVAIRFAFGIIH